MTSVAETALTCDRLEGRSTVADAPALAALAADSMASQPALKCANPKSRVTRAAREQSAPVERTNDELPVRKRQKKTKTTNAEKTATAPAGEATSMTCASSREACHALVTFWHQDTEQTFALGSLSEDFYDTVHRLILADLNKSANRCAKNNRKIPQAFDLGH